MGRIARAHRSKGVLLCMLLAAGCQAPSAPPPPGGGQAFVLDYQKFQDDVAPVLAQAGCRASECHGGGIRGTFRLSPQTALDPQLDFEQASLQVDPYDPVASPLLTRPLAEDAGGTRHEWEPFSSTDDPGYRAILDWILAGRFE
jgi:hypothetical protein